MIEVAGAALWTPGGLLAVRRSPPARQAPRGKLHFFQAILGPGENPINVMEGVLENDLRWNPGFEPTLPLRLGELGVKEFSILSSHLRYHVYETNLLDANFSDREGQPPEVYSPQDLLDRPDISEVTRVLLVEEFAQR
jgi:hypothetical protein